MRVYASPGASSFLPSGRLWSGTSRLAERIDKARDCHEQHDTRQKQRVDHGLPPILFTWCTASILYSLYPGKHPRGRLSLEVVNWPVPQRRCKKRSHGENSALSASSPTTTMSSMMPITWSSVKRAARSARQLSSCKKGKKGLIGNNISLSITPKTV